MAVYGYDSRRVESIIGAMKRSRLRHCVIASTVLVAAAGGAWVRPAWIFGSGAHARVWVVIALFVFFAGPMAETLGRWKSRPLQLEESLRSTRIEIVAERIAIANLQGVRKLARHEIH